MSSNVVETKPMSSKVHATSTKVTAPNPQWTFVPVRQSAETVDLLDVSYGMRVVINSLLMNGHSIAAQEQGDSVSKVSKASAASRDACTFSILNSSKPRDQGVVHLHDSVCFRTDKNYFLTAGENGEVQISKLKKGSEHHVKWIVCNREFGDEKTNRKTCFVGNVKMFDSLCFQAYNGCFLSMDEAFSLNVTDTSTSDGTCWSLSKDSLPFLASWTRTRELELAGFGTNSVHDNKTNNDVSSLNSLPPKDQEILVLRDVLFTLVGIEGKYIKKVEVPEAIMTEKSGLLPFQFKLHQDVNNVSLVNLLARLLPVCEFYTNIQYYITVHSRFEYGLVCHALASMLKSMMKEYLVLIAQLESLWEEGSLTISRAWFYIQPSVSTLERLSHLCLSTRHQRGGALLSTLYNLTQLEGDTKTRTLYRGLVTAASEPYFEMVSSWIYQGIIHDPYDEFQILLRTDLNKENLRKDFNDSYWDERYTVRKDKIPVFLESVSDKILITGKYLNVIAECGGLKNAPQRKTLHFTEMEQDYVNAIDIGYDFASQSLLKLLLQEHNLLERLYCLKQYFLLAQGDFLVSFMDLAQKELQKPVQQVSLHKLRSYLDTSLRSSESNSYKDDLDCYLQPMTLLQKLDAIHKTNDARRNSQTPAELKQDTKQVISLNGLESFSLQFNVKWPVSLVMSQKTLTKYTFLFRHLFFCKHVERNMSETWKSKSIVLLSRMPTFRHAFVMAFGLRHRMLHFIQNFIYHMMIEVIEPHWHELERDIKQAQTVDVVLRKHNFFLDSCLKECLLTNIDLLNILVSLFKTCLNFAASVHRFANSLQNEVTVSSLSNPLSQTLQNSLSASTTEIEQAQTKFIALVRKASDSFDKDMGAFVQHLRTKDFQHYLTSMYTSLDFNNFYSKRFPL